MNGEVLIRKQTINLTTSNERIAFDCRNYLNEIIKNSLFDAYERIFYQEIDQDSYVNINKLKVDLGVLTLNDFKTQFLELVEEKVIVAIKQHFEAKNINGTKSEISQQKLDRQSSSETEESIVYHTEQGQLILALLHFLSYGNYPWWYSKHNRPSPAAVLNKLDDNGKKELLIKLLHKRQSLTTPDAELVSRRFVTNLTDDNLTLYVKLLKETVDGQGFGKQLELLLQEMQLLEEVFKIDRNTCLRHFLVFALQSKDQENITHSFLISLTQILAISNTEMKKRLTEQKLNILKQTGSIIQNELISITKTNLVKKATPSKKAIHHQEFDTGLYIGNAGLILLHPFLSTYFNSLGLTTNQHQFLSEKKQLKAVVLLHYLQTGADSYQEFELSLNKILCGMLPTDLVIAGIKITKKEKAESEILLKTVIGYWDALKGSSTGALQNTFLTREGKVTLKDSSWLLQIERTGVDVLLDRLPWTIGTVKLPWLDKMIYTEW